MQKPLRSTNTFRKGLTKAMVFFELIYMYIFWGRFFWQNNRLTKVSSSIHTLAGSPLFSHIQRPTDLVLLCPSPACTGANPWGMLHVSPLDGHNTPLQILHTAIHQIAPKVAFNGLTRVPDLARPSMSYTGLYYRAPPLGKVSWPWPGLSWC